MAEASTNGAAPRETMNWLKGLLDAGEDSSDSTPQPKEQKPIPDKSKSVGKKLKQSPGRKAHKKATSIKEDAMVEARREQQDGVNGIVKQRQEGSDGTDGDDAPTRQRSESGQTHQHSHHGPHGKTHQEKISMTSLVDTGGKRRRRKLEGTSGKMPQRKRPHVVKEKGADEKERAAELEVKDPIDPAKAKAAALRQRRMKKLHARRKATGEHERLAAVKLKRHELSEVSRLKRNQREQMRKTRKAPAAADIDAKINGEGKERPHSAPLSAEEAKERKRMLERQRLATIKANKELRELKSPSGSTLKRPRSAGSNKERRQQRKHEVLHTLEAPSGDHAESSKKRQKLAHVTEGPESAAGSGIPHVKSPSKVSERCAAGKKAVENAMVAGAPHERNAVNSRPSSAINNVNGPQSQEHSVQNQEPCQVKEEVKEEGQVDSSALPRSVHVAVKPQDKDENAISDVKEDMLLDMAPIPRRTITVDAPAPSSAASFVIPKRYGKNTEEQVEVRGMSRAIPAGPHSDHKPLGGRVPVAMKPLPSPDLSPQLSNRDPIRPQQKRTKYPVPVKNSMLSAYDKIIMRLARKRNSIFLAAAELAAQSPSADNKLPATRMTGYEVCDADGKVLPDLVPRLSCATKRDMSADKDSFAASFFGVSLVAPKAKGTVSPAVEKCADMEGRHMNCYEELCFERPEDRDFYQQRMYGTTFVPQHLRGRATLIIRSARFERKSTGIRFNQDRDREELAASLSKRYTFKKSVPRCEIPRENWQKIMRNQPGIVYLHYNNIEDAERASYLFRDDSGNSLELKREHKSRVVGSRESSPADGVESHRTPRRSCSSERSPPKSSPQSSQGVSARNTPHWQRERQRSTNRSSRYDRPPSAQRNGSEGQYGPSVNGCRSRSRSRSHSRPKRFPGQQHDSAAKGTDSETGNEELVSACEVAKRGAQDSKSTSKSDRGGDAPDRAALPSAPFSPRRSTQDRSPRDQDLESGEEQEEGEMESSAVAVPESIDRSNDRGGRQCSRSPLRSWQQPDDVQSHQRQEDYRGHPYEQHYNCGPDRRRSRSRSRPRPEGFAPWGGGGRDDGWDSSYAKERRPREYGPADDYDNRRRMYSATDRYGGRDHRGGGYSDDRDDAYPRPYY
ncbi:hypothetical protein PHYPSEUDO_011037 [Phytophthora pseudosyringae]|uniref:Uncharacterized protein n=1 Tax=Phytophthora pseudosyringae TaxID=221518 RepID=A0A8T1V919_9STRA|nr:hypothetical protein PHYPSEUDO_011037 [Phytophthora pseudosyringae]